MLRRASREHIAHETLKLDRITTVVVLVVVNQLLPFLITRAVDFKDASDGGWIGKRALVDTRYN